MSEINTSHLKITRNPDRRYHYSIGPSGLHGIGIFASKNLKPGDKISVFLWHKDGNPRSFIRDESCRFCNHSDDRVNAVVLPDGDDFSLYSSSAINDGDEILINYPKSVQTIAQDGLFALPSIVRARTKNYIPFLKDKKNRSLHDELEEIFQGKWK